MIKNCKLLTALGVILGAGILFAIYYFTTYAPLGGSWFRALLVPSVFGGVAGGLLMNSICMYLKSRRHSEGSSPSEKADGEAEDKTKKADLT